MTIAAALAGLGACTPGVDELTLAKGPCPCADEWHCCEGAQVCAASEDACDLLGEEDAGPSFADALVGSRPDAGPLPGPRAIVEGQETPVGLVSHHGLAWANAGTGDVMWVVREGDSWEVQRVASGDPGIVAIASDHPFYWANPATGEIQTRVDGDVVTLAGGQGNLTDIAVRDPYVYWVTTGQDDTPADGTVARVSQEGGAVEILADGLPGPSSLAVSETYVYFTNSSDAENGNSVMRVRLEGGAPETLASGQAGPMEVAALGAGVHWINAGEAGQGNGSLMRLVLPGGDPEAIAEGIEAPKAFYRQNYDEYYYLAADGVYLVNPEEDSTVELVELEPADRRGLVFVHGHAYWANVDDGTIVELQRH